MINSHSHKKLKDNLEGSQIQVLFVADLELLMIVLPRLPKNSSKVNIEGTKKRKQLY